MSERPLVVKAGDVASGRGSERPFCHQGRTRSGGFQGGRQRHPNSPAPWFLETYSVCVSGPCPPPLRFPGDQEGAGLSSGRETTADPRGGWGPTAQTASHCDLGHTISQPPPATSPANWGSHCPSRVDLGSEAQCRECTQCEGPRFAHRPGGGAQGSSLAHSEALGG